MVDRSSQSSACALLAVFVYATHASHAKRTQCKRLRCVRLNGNRATQALAFLAVFLYATHATQAIAFEWEPGFRKKL